jgi:hypothetical protein
MDSVFTYFPFICVLVVLANAAVFRVRARRLARGDEEAIREYRTVIRGFVFYLAGWFVAQGVGILAGAVSAYAVPTHRSGGVTGYDWFLFALTLFINFRFAVWVYHEGGASVLARCRGIFNAFPETPGGVRLLVGLIVAVSLAGSATLLWQARHPGG